MAEPARLEDDQGAPPDILCRVVGDEALLLDTRTGDYFSLDRIGTEVWLGLDAGLDADAVAAQIAERYGVARDMVRRDVLELMEELRDARLWRS